MGRVSRCTLAVFLAFLLFSTLLVCCAPGQRPTNELAKDLLMRNWPSSWEIRRRDIHPIRHGSEDAQEFCVFYEVEDDSEVFTDALMYRLADGAVPPLTVPLPYLRPYTLSLPETTIHFCECTCHVESGDLLGPYAHQMEDELIVQDRCGDRTTRLFIYHWIPEAKIYYLFGFFHAYDIQLEYGASNQAIVDYQPRPGAEWVHRCTYQPCDRSIDRVPGVRATAAFLDPECAKRYIKCEFVFYKKIPSPKAIRESPYPETVLLAFYKTYSDWETVSTYFTRTVDADFCADGRCGCDADPEDVISVTVNDMVVNEHGCVDTNVCYEDHPDSFLYDWARIQVSVTCQTNEDPGEELAVTWRVTRVDGGGWRLDSILDDEE